jgi:recombination protein RecA
MAVKKKANLTQIAKDVAKVLKEDHVVTLNPDSLKQSLPHISTGSVALDYLIGGKENVEGVRPCPGIPKGRITNLYGLAGAGKTTIALQTAAQVCAEGGTCVYIDWEHEVDHRYASILGVPVADPNHFMLIQPDTLEAGLRYIFSMADAGVDLIVLDSVGAAVPKAFFENNDGSSMAVGLTARIWSQYLPKIKSRISETETAIIGISQLREAIGGGGPSFAGPKKIPQGGKAWSFFSTLQIMLSVIGKEKGKEWDAMQGKQSEVVLGTHVRAKLDKCKVSDSAHKEVDFFLMSGEGVDNVRTVLELGIKAGVISKKGAWFSWQSNEGEIRGQGLNAFKELLTNDHVNQIFAQVKPYLADPKTKSSSEESPSDFDVMDEVTEDDLLADLDDL